MSLLILSAKNIYWLTPISDIRPDFGCQGDVLFCTRQNMHCPTTPWPSEHRCTHVLHYSSKCGRHPTSYRKKPRLNQLNWLPAIRRAAWWVSPPKGHWQRLTRQAAAPWLPIPAPLWWRPGLPEISLKEKPCSLWFLRHCWPCCGFLPPDVPNRGIC